MFKKFLANTIFLWLLALIIIIEGLMLANLELAPMPEIRQPAVLGVKTESDVADVELLPESLSPTVIDEIENKIQQKIDIASIENQTTAADQSVHQPAELTASLIINKNFRLKENINPFLAENQNTNISSTVNNDDNSNRQNNLTETATALNNNEPIPAEKKTDNVDQVNKKEEIVEKTEEQLKIEEINKILNQPETKINLKKYQPALATEIFNPIKELIKKNIEIFNTLTE